MSAAAKLDQIVNRLSRAGQPTRLMHTSYDPTGAGFLHTIHEANKDVHGKGDWTPFKVWADHLEEHEGHPELANLMRLTADQNEKERDNLPSQWAHGLNWEVMRGPQGFGFTTHKNENDEYGDWAHVIELSHDSNSIQPQFAFEVSRPDIREKRTVWRYQTHDGNHFDNIVNGLRSEGVPEYEYATNEWKDHGQRLKDAGDNTQKSTMPRTPGEEAIGRMQGVIDEHHREYGAPGDRLSRIIGSLVRLAKPTPKVEPFYSSAERVIQDKVPNRADPEQVRRTLAGAGVKPDEMKWSGLEQHLKSATEPVRKDDLLEHMRNNNIKVNEVWKGHTISELPNDVEHSLEVLPGNTRQSFVYRGGGGRLLGHGFTQERARNEALARLNSDSKETRYDEYQLPGGGNYREMLLTLPTKIPETPQAKLLLRHADDMVKKHGWDSKEYADAYARYEQIGRPHYIRQPYQSPHWDEPNVLAHVRMSDRIIPSYTREQIKDIGERIAKVVGAKTIGSIGSGGPFQAVKRGVITPLEAAQFSHASGFSNEDQSGALRKILHVEEIQSDWHQSGRKSGYAGETFQYGDGKKYTIPQGYSFERDATSNPRHVEYILKNGDMEVARGTDRASVVEKAVAKGLIPKTMVPDAPFKKNWHELAMRHVIDHAVRNGYDGISWTPGDAQADRYDLSNQVDQLQYDPEKKHLFAIKDGKTLIDKEDVEPKDLPDLIGKDATDRLLNAKLAESTLAGPVGRKTHTLAGDDLKVGGHGMRGFYDKIIPDYLNRYASKWGAQVGSVSIPNRLFHTVYDPNTGSYIVKDDRGTPWRFGDNKEAAEANAQRLQDKHSFVLPHLPITPVMREHIKKEGQVLFARSIIDLIRFGRDNDSMLQLAKTPVGGLRMLPFQGGLIEKAKTLPNLEEEHFTGRPTVGVQQEVGRGKFAGTVDERGHGDGIVHKLTTPAGGLHPNASLAATERVTLNKTLLGMGVPINHPQFGREAATRWVEAASNLVRSAPQDPYVVDYVKAAHDPGHMEIHGEAPTNLAAAARSLLSRTGRLNPWLNHYNLLAYKQKEADLQRDEAGKPKRVEPEPELPPYNPAIKPSEDVTLPMTSMPGERARSPENQTKYSRIKHFEDLWGKGASREQAIESISRTFLVSPKAAADAWRRFVNKKAAANVKSQLSMFFDSARSFIRFGKDSDNAPVRLEDEEDPLDMGGLVGYQSPVDEQQSKLAIGREATRKALAGKSGRRQARMVLVTDPDKYEFEPNPITHTPKINRKTGVEELPKGRDESKKIHKLVVASGTLQSDYRKDVIKQLYREGKFDANPVVGHWLNDPKVGGGQILDWLESHGITNPFSPGESWHSSVKDPQARRTTVHVHGSEDTGKEYGGVSNYTPEVVKYFREHPDGKVEDVTEQLTPFKKKKAAAANQGTDNAVRFVVPHLENFMGIHTGGEHHTFVDNASREDLKNLTPHIAEAVRGLTAPAEEELPPPKTVPAAPEVEKTDLERHLEKINEALRAKNGGWGPGIEWANRESIPPIGKPKAPPPPLPGDPRSVTPTPQTSPNERGLSIAKPLGGISAKDGVHELIADTRLAHHLRMIERDHPMLKELTDRALKGQAKKGEEANDVFKQLGQHLRGTKYENAYRWDRVRDGLRLDNVVRNFVDARKHTVPGATFKSLANAFKRYTDAAAAGKPLRFKDAASQEFWNDIHSLANKVIDPKNPNLKRDTVGMVYRSLLRNAFRAEDRADKASATAPEHFNYLPGFVGGETSEQARRNAAAKATHNAERFRRGSPMRFATAPVHPDFFRQHYVEKRGPHYYVGSVIPKRQPSGWAWSIHPMPGEFFPHSPVGLKKMKAKYGEDVLERGDAAPNVGMDVHPHIVDAMENGFQDFDTRPNEMIPEDYHMSREMREAIRFAEAEDAPETHSGAFEPNHVFPIKHNADDREPFQHQLLDDRHNKAIRDAHVGLMAQPNNPKIHTAYAKSLIAAADVLKNAHDYTNGFPGTPEQARIAHHLVRNDLSNKIQWHSRLASALESGYQRSNNSFEHYLRETQDIHVPPRDDDMLWKREQLADMIEHEGLPGDTYSDEDREMSKEIAATIRHDIERYKLTAAGKKDEAMRLKPPKLSTLARKKAYSSGINILRPLTTLEEMSPMIDPKSDRFLGGLRMRNDTKLSRGAEVIRLAMASPNSSEAYNDIFRSAARVHFTAPDFHEKLMGMDDASRNRHDQSLHQFLNADLLGIIRRHARGDETLAHDVATKVMFGDGESAFFKGYKPADANLLPRFVSFVRGYVSHHDAKQNREVPFSTLGTSPNEVQMRPTSDLRRDPKRIRAAKEGLPSSVTNFADHLRVITDNLRSILSSKQDIQRKVQQSAESYPVEAPQDRIVTRQTQTPAHDTPEGRIAAGHTPWLGDPNEFEFNPEEIKNVHDFFQKSVDLGDFLKAANAQHNSTVHFSHTTRDRMQPSDVMKLADPSMGWNGSPVLTVSAHNEQHGGPRTNNGHSYSRGIFFRDHDGKVRFYNDYEIIGPHFYKEHGSGFGRQMTREKILALERLGISKVHAQLEQSPGAGFYAPRKEIPQEQLDPSNRDHFVEIGFQGGRVWPLAGYGGTIRPLHRGRMPKAMREQLKAISPTADVRDLIDKVPGGAEWWQKHPDTIMHGYMDLARGAPTREAHEKWWNEYSAKKGIYDNPATKPGARENLVRTVGSFQRMAADRSGTAQVSGSRRRDAAVSGGAFGRAAPAPLAADQGRIPSGVGGGRVVRFARVPDNEVHADYRPTGIAPRVGHMLQVIAEGRQHPEHADSNTMGLAATALKTGNHKLLPILADALMDVDHPLQDAINWRHAPRGIAIDKVLADEIAKHQIRGYPAPLTMYGHTAAGVDLAGDRRSGQMQPLSAGWILADWRQGARSRVGRRKALAFVRQTIPDATFHDLHHSILRLVHNDEIRRDTPLVEGSQLDQTGQHRGNLWTPNKVIANPVHPQWHENDLHILKQFGTPLQSPHTYPDTRPPSQQHYMNREGQPIRFDQLNENSSDFASALQRLQTLNHDENTKVFKSILDTLGFVPHKIFPVLHDMGESTRPAVAAAVMKEITQPESLYAASWGGLLTRQPGMLSFQSHDDGPDSLYRLGARGSGEALKQLMEQNGIGQSVIIPRDNGDLHVLIHDKDRQLRKNVAGLARALGSNVGESRGTSTVLGGSDPAESRAAYRDTIREAEQPQQQVSNAGTFTA